MEKKGGLTSTQIVIIITVLVGFAILLIIFYQIASTERIDRDTCHTSVLARAVLYSDKPFLKGSTELVPLRCKTHNICVTTNKLLKGDCSEKIEKYSTVRVSNDERKLENQINMVIAREMLDCWEMLGEGKVNFLLKEDFMGNKCVLCSRISFDNSIGSHKFDDFNYYLFTREAPNVGVSYMEFFAGEPLQEGKNFNWSSGSLVANNIDTTKEYAIVFSSINSGMLKDNWGKLAIAGGGAVLVVVSGFFTGGIVPYLLGLVVAGTGTTISVSSIVSIYTSSSDGKVISSINLVPLEREDIRALNCDVFEHIP